jgi:hypothetical protein
MRSVPRSLRNECTATWSAFFAVSGGPVAPEPVHQALARDDGAAVQEQEHEERLLPAASELDRGAVPDDLERSEQPEVRARALVPRHRRKRAVSGR